MSNKYLEKIASILDVKNLTRLTKAVSGKPGGSIVSKMVKETVKPTPAWKSGKVLEKSIKKDIRSIVPSRVKNLTAPAKAQKVNEAFKGNSFIREVSLKDRIKTRG